MVGFTADELTLALLKVEYLPGAVGRLNLFAPKPQSLTSVSIELRGGRLALVPDMPRGAPPTPNVEDRRALVRFEVPHFPIRDTILADAVQDVRAFGTMLPEGFQTVVDERLASMGQRLDVTLEHLRLGAVKGIVITAIDRDTGAPLRQVNLFDEFGVPPQPVLDWPIIGAGAIGQDAAAWEAQLTLLVNALGRGMADELPGGMLSEIRGFCGAQFFDAFTAHPDRRSAFIGFPAAATIGPLRGREVVFRDVTIEEYRGQVAGVPFVEPDLCHFVPLGIPDLFVEAYAPGDYIEAINRPALPRYAKSQPLEFDKGMKIEAQMNVLPLCTMPRALFTARATPYQPPAPEAAARPAPPPAAHPGRRAAA